MLYQNVHCMQAAIIMYCRHPVTPLAATQWYRLLLYAAYGLQHTLYCALSVGMIQQFFFFCPS